MAPAATSPLSTTSAAVDGTPSTHTSGGHLSPSSSAAAATTAGFSQANTRAPGAHDGTQAVTCRNVSRSGSAGHPGRLRTNTSQDRSSQATPASDHARRQSTASAGNGAPAKNVSA